MPPHDGASSGVARDAWVQPRSEVGPPAEGGDGVAGQGGFAPAPSDTAFAPTPVRHDTVVVRGALWASGRIGSWRFSGGSATWPFGQLLFHADSLSITSSLPSWAQALFSLPSAGADRASGARILLDEGPLSGVYRLWLPDGSRSRLAFLPVSHSNVERTAREFGWAVVTESPARP